MRTLSLRQPWAWLVVHGGKTIENRKWNTRIRGEFLIHASKGMTGAEYFDAVQWTAKRGHAVVGRMPAAKEFDRGGIVGIARLVDVIAPHLFAEGDLRDGTHFELFPTDCNVRSGGWHMHEQYGFVLANVRPIPFIPCTGMLGFFSPPANVIEQAMRSIPGQAVT